MASSHIMLNADRDRDRAQALALRSEALRRSLTTYFARRIHDRDEVQDLVQEVFLRVVQRDGTEVIEHVNGYMFQTARSVLADRQRRRSARHADAHVAFDAEQHGGEDVDAGRRLEDKAELRAATAALLTLPDRTRTIFILKRLEGLRHRDIAVRLGISVSAVEKHMLRAVQHLAAELGGGR